MTVTDAGFDRAAADPIALEVLRSRLQAVAEEGAITIERTAISPIIIESRDYSCTLLEADGSMMVAGGAISHHFGICGPAVHVTMATHAGSIAPGDVFLSNDPYNGGGLHPQDVVVQMPVFHHDTLIGWVVNSGHLIDLGGMVFGSWSPAATECYQEALRFPPVRLFRAGVEQPDVWGILRTNVRQSAMVEMDLRSLVAGCQVAADKLISIADGMGTAGFVDGVAELRRLAEAEMRRRIRQLADGEYSYDMWVEWHDELYQVPTRMTVRGDELVFDFDGAPPQADHFFNTQPHIVTAGVVGDISDVLTYDLPLNEGMFAPVTVNCPAGTIMHSAPPAPVASAHCDVALAASTAATECVMMAIAASQDSEVAHLATGPIASTTLAIQIWAYVGPFGPDGWMMLDGAMGGAAAAHDHDGIDLSNFMVSRAQIMEASDVESLEAAYPMLVDFKRARGGAFGEGTFRSGGGAHMQLRPHGVPQIVGQCLAIREDIPLNGAAGGFPGGVCEFTLHRADGTSTALPGKSSDVVLTDGDAVEFALATAGGYGDPLDRDPQRVARDVRCSRITAEVALASYGVVMHDDGSPDPQASDRQRDEIRAERLLAARPAATAVAGPARPGDLDLPPQRLFVGVQRRGATAVAEQSGAILAHAPDSWTSGCPTLERQVAPAIIERTYLDPRTGRSLLVEAVPSGSPLSIVSSPDHWTRAARETNHMVG
ncbi:hydantoinase B/oxoprolinase family protein [Nakamurella lactea]|uniref:hydantoinase B/oxoprolinase family protein n=1 Tax=Nakamurella lactea TaxID=459515 RepID=UPI0003F66B7B|nr:hydantoinase B/oxoprolinase family protein [Nakamurella lactea]